ncbi:MAG: YveK family protein [Acetivibrionales bacterium]|jgi:capsular polysaccharide biosynthesis protein|nr:hypothetical protein [Clostridiaceae bacterium]
MAEYSIKDIFNILIRRWWVLVGCMLIFGLTIAIWTVYYVTPMYEAYSTIYVGKNSDDFGLTTTDLYIGESVIYDYQEIVKSRIVATAVLEALGYDDVNPNYLAKSINAAQKPNTHVIQISLRNPDPETAMILVNMVAEVFKEKVTDIMQVDNVQIIDKAEMPLYPVSPNKKMNISVGIFIGLCVGVGVLFLIEFFNDSVRTPEDIKKHINLPVIGTIPAFKTQIKED